MSRIKVIVVGATRSPFLKEGERYYLKKLRRYAPTDWIEVKPRKVTSGRSTEEILRGEGQAIVKKCLPDDEVIVLDPRGREYDSPEFAALLEGLHRKTKQISFVIGGPLGLSREILDRAGHAVSLSRMTLTHEMSRLILLEQLYRAHTLIKGEKYHK